MFSSSLGAGIIALPGQPGVEASAQRRETSDRSEVRINPTKARLGVLRASSGLAGRGGGAWRVELGGWPIFGVAAPRRQASATIFSRGPPPEFPPSEA